MSPQARRCCRVWKTNLSHMKGSRGKTVWSVDTETVSLKGFTSCGCI
jgi:hypothetical protein